MPVTSSLIVPTIGYAVGIAAADADTALGPKELNVSNFNNILSAAGVTLDWQAMLEVENDPHKSVLQKISDVNLRLAHYTKNFVAHQQRFLVFGGDHSSAIGTWSGVSEALEDGELGLLWLDAHLDAHTPETTESGAIHGMPVAALLGFGYPTLTTLLSSRQKLKAQNLCLIGVKSFEAGEKFLMERLGVKVIYMDEIRKIGLSQALKQGLDYLKQKTKYIGISIDLDVIDATDLPGTGYPDAGGVRAAELCDALQQLQHEPLLGYEIVEFNPRRDINQQSEKVIWQLLSALFLGRKL